MRFIFIIIIGGLEEEEEAHLVVIIIIALHACCTLQVRFLYAMAQNKNWGVVVAEKKNSLCHKTV